MAIVSGALRWCSSCLQISPASSRILESRPLISDSSVCSACSLAMAAAPRVRSSILRRSLLGSPRSEQRRLEPLGVRRGVGITS